MALQVNSRTPNFIFATTIIIVLLTACNRATHTPSLLGTPMPTTSSIITIDNIDRLTELAHWSVNGWVKSCLLFSPDSRFLAIASDNDTDMAIQLRDITTGYTVGTFTGLTSRVESLAFSPNSETLAASSYGKILKIWNIKSGQELQSLSFPDAIFGIAFSPDGKLLAVGMRDGRVQLLNTDSGQLLRTFPGHTDLVNSVVFSPDGTKLISGSFDSMIKLWHVSSGEEIQNFTGHSNSVWKVSLSPDGKTLASASTDGTVRLWNVATGQEVLVLKDDTVLEWFDVDFSIDGRYLAAASQHRLVIWDAGSGRKLRTIDNLETGIDTISFSSDGKLLAIGGDGAVQVWGVP